jgi:hypothetical protein
MRPSFSRIFGAPQIGCSLLSCTINDADDVKPAGGGALYGMEQWSYFEWGRVVDLARI